MAKQNKYTYEKVIQQHFNCGWEDVSSYEATSSGRALDRQLFKHDYNEYRYMGYPCRSVLRRTLNATSNTGN